LAEQILSTDAYARSIHEQKLLAVKLETEALPVQKTADNYFRLCILSFYAGHHPAAVFLSTASVTRGSDPVLSTRSYHIPEIGHVSRMPNFINQFTNRQLNAVHDLSELCACAGINSWFVGVDHHYFCNIIIRVDVQSQLDNSVPSCADVLPGKAVQFGDLFCSNHVSLLFAVVLVKTMKRTPEEVLAIGCPHQSPFS
jgi:hypothetical protein